MAASDDKDGLVWVNGVSYDVRSFSKEHPGGPTFVSLYGGRDATDAFATYHRRAFPHESMKRHLVDTSAIKPQKAATSSTGQDDPEYLALAKEVNGFLHKTNRNNGFAPMRYYIKVAFLLSMAVYFEYQTVTSPSFLSAVITGFFFALIGLNVQHDANHGAVSANPIINTLLGLTQDWIGGNSLLWLQQHVAIHHIECNDLDHDKDAMENPLLRFSPLHTRYAWEALQGYYFILLEAGYAAKVIIADWGNLLMNSYEGEAISKAVPSWRWPLSIAARLCWITRLVVLPIYLHGWQAWLPYLVVMNMVGGLYLAFFFLLSHNFEEVHHIIDQQLVPARDPLGVKQPHSNTLLRRQVLTSSNVGGPILAELNGGLNYQIEHHLFPRVHHSHYAAISPMVRAYCTKLGVQYIHYPTVWDNLKSTSRFLSHQGNAPQLLKAA